MRRISSFRSERNKLRGSSEVGTYQWGQNEASSVVEVVEKRQESETFGGGEFIEVPEEKIRRRVTSYPACLPWY